MTGIIHRTVLELEVLEERCAPTAVATGPTTKNQTTGTNPNEPNAIPTNPFGISSVVKSAVDVKPATNPNLTGKLTLTPGLAPTIPGVSPLGAGVGPVNGSIPNGAGVQSNSAGLGGLSPFLPTYYLNYTQVGPFYTGSGYIPPAGSSGSGALTPSSTDGTQLADAAEAPAADVPAIPEAALLSLLLLPTAG